MSASTTPVAIPAFSLEPLKTVGWQFLSEASMFGSCNALNSLSLSTAKNTPYILGKETTVVAFLSSRQNCLEVAGYAALGTVINLAGVFFYSALAICTKGLSLVSSQFTQMHQEAFFECKKNWVHTALSSSSCAVGSIGIISPVAGAISHLAQLFFVAGAASHILATGSLNEILKTTKTLFQTNKAWIEHHAQKNDSLKNIVTKLDQRLPQVNTWEEFFKMISDLRSAP